MSKRIADLTPQQLTEEAYKLLTKDRARLASTNYPLYRGPTSAPMSSLAQNARQLKEGWQQRPAPFSQKIETVLNRGNRGLSPESMQGLLETLKQGQRGFTQNAILGALQNQFGGAYNPRTERFTRKGEKDINKGSLEAAEKLREVSKLNENLEQSRNQQIIKALQGFQQNKQGRREGLVSNLEQLGNQQHAYTNMLNKAQQAQFNQEVQNPQKKIEMLERALEPHRTRGNEPIHPDLHKPISQEITNALKAYGVDIAKPVGEWEKTKIEPAPYRGELVAPIPDEIKVAQSILERINPKFREAGYEERKNLVRGFLENENIGNRTIQNIPPVVRERINQLELQAKQKLNKDMAAINNEYIRLGQYGSPQHIAAAERRARELNKSVIEQENALYEHALKNQLQFGHTGEINNLKKLNQLGAQGQQEYVNMLQNIQDVNKRGSTKWRNKQGENEEAYKNYQNERLWEWPHMRNAVRNETQHEIFPGANQYRGISLEDLAKQNTERYSEVERENPRVRHNILTSPEARNAMPLEFQNLQRARDQEAQRLAQEAAARAVQEAQAREGQQAQARAAQAAQIQPQVPNQTQIARARQAWHENRQQEDQRMGTVRWGAGNAWNKFTQTPEGLRYISSF